MIMDTNSKLTNTKKKSGFPWWGYVLVLMFAGILGLAILPEQYDNYRNYIGYFKYHHETIQDHAKDVLKTAKENGIMPRKDRWCYLAMKYGGWSPPSGFTWDQYDFETSKRYQEYTAKWDLAYNENLSGMDYNSIPGETVLIFEAEGPWNLSGGPELLKPKRLKRKYIGLFKETLDTVLIAFVDGSVAKYRFTDKAIAVYDPNTEQFAPFTTNSKYLPLRWEP
jgi:hypothetical protein